MTGLIETGSSPRTLWVRVSGAATMKIAPAFLDCIQRGTREPPADVLLDLSGCTWLDSTFIGSLVQVSQSAASSCSWRFHLCNPSEACLNTLGKMSMIRLFNVHSDPAPKAMCWSPWVTRETSRDALAETVIHAHERLADVDPGNREFRRVADVFRRELSKRQHQARD